jgi:hypothetical protein
MTMPWDNLALVAATLLAPLAATALIGATVLLLCFLLLGAPPPTWGQCLRAYLLATGYGVMALLAINIVRPQPHSSWGQVVLWQAGVFGVTHLIVVCCLLRKFSSRSLAAQVVGVALTNLVMCAIILPALGGGFAG